MKLTPYCKNFGSSGDPLPCLDLDFISFCDAVHADQGGKGYAIQPQNCTSNPGNPRTWGCSVGWLMQISPVSPLIPDPASIVAGGTSAFPESPVGYNQPCSTSLPCYGLWISPYSRFGEADVLGTFSTWVTSKIIPDSVALNISVDLPPTPMDYTARFYSGGSADTQELANIASYTNGKAL